MKESTSLVKISAVLVPLFMAIGLTSCSSNMVTQQSGTPPAEETMGGGTGGGGAAPTPVSNEVDHKRKGFVVQLIASAYPERANEIKKRFIQDGYEAFVDPIVRDHQTLYRVQIGPYGKEQDAKQVLNSMRTHYPQDELIREAFVNYNK